jgi:hypothetical protein
MAVTNSLTPVGDALEEKSIDVVGSTRAAGSGDREAERPGSLEIDDQFWLGAIVPVRVLKN